MALHKKWFEFECSWGYLYLRLSKFDLFYSDTFGLVIYNSRVFFSK